MSFLSTYTVRHGVWVVTQWLIEQGRERSRLHMNISLLHVDMSLLCKSTHQEKRLIEREKRGGKRSLLYIWVFLFCMWIRLFCRHLCNKTWFSGWNTVTWRAEKEGKRGLFGMWISRLHMHTSLLHGNRSLLRMIGLFCIWIGLFCIWIRLFSGPIR